MKIKATFPTIDYIGTCHQCGETHLATQFGDAIIEDKPVCAFCQRNPKATERSEGARPSEARQRKSPNA